MSSAVLFSDTVCLGCSKPFQPSKYKNASVFCSQTCRQQVKNAYGRKIAPILAAGFDCPTCGKHFYPTRKRKYCSRECHAGRQELCLFCGKTFIAHGSNKTCSLSCGQQLREQTAPMIEKNCRVCGKVFECSAHRQSRSFCCSVRCWDRARDKGRNAYLRTYSRYRRQLLEYNSFPKMEVVRSTEIYERDNWTCWLCHAPVNRKAHGHAPDAPSLDHVIPVTKGGSHTADNLRCAHRQCNTIKNNRDPKGIEFVPPEYSGEWVKPEKKQKETEESRLAAAKERIDQELFGGGHGA